MEAIIIFGIILITGFIFGELVQKIKLPKVTGYILAGIALNPDLFDFVPPNFIEGTHLITNISLSIITFSVGGTLLLSKIRKLGKGILWITLLEAEFAFLFVFACFLIITPLFLDIPDATWLTVFIPISLLISSLASPTDPSSTLAIVHQYKAKGEVTSTIMGVAALDDALGIVNFSVALALASSFLSGDSFGMCALATPLITIGGSILLGSLFGLLLNGITSMIKNDSAGVFIVVIIGLLLLCFGWAHWFDLDELLSTMVMGIVVVNFNKQREKIFGILEDSIEELIFVLFFTISGMHLNFSILSSAYVLVLFFVVFRATGKYTGTYLGASISHVSLKIKKHAASGLIPQGGIVIGLALMIKQKPEFDAVSDIVITTIIGATVVHELLGPVLAKRALQQSGEIEEDA